VLITLMEVLASVLLFFWAHTAKPGASRGPYLYDGGVLVALVGFLLVLFQYLLGSKLRVVEKGTGMDTLSSFHRKSGMRPASDVGTV